MSNVNKNKWDESYDRNENHTLYPKEEVVKFLNRFVRKKLGDNKFIDILMTDREKLRGLDCGCGIGRMTMLLNEFNIDSYGVDISKVAIQKAKELFPVLSNKFAKIDGKVIPFKDSYFDISICESVIDSMNYNVAKKHIKKGELFSNNNLTVKRPGTGISPMEWDNIMGKSSNDNYKVDDLIKL